MSYLGKGHLLKAIDRENYDLIKGDKEDIAHVSHVHVAVRHDLSKRCGRAEVVLKDILCWGVLRDEYVVEAVHGVLQQHSQHSGVAVEIVVKGQHEAIDHAKCRQVFGQGPGTRDEELRPAPVSAAHENEESDE
jgi:hypothetical protein